MGSAKVKKNTFCHDCSSANRRQYSSLITYWYVVSGHYSIKRNYNDYITYHLWNDRPLYEINQWMEISNTKSLQIFNQQGAPSLK